MGVEPRKLYPLSTEVVKTTTGHCMVIMFYYMVLQDYYIFIYIVYEPFRRSYHSDTRTPMTALRIAHNRKSTLHVFTTVIQWVSRKEVLEVVDDFGVARTERWIRLFTGDGLGDDGVGQTLGVIHDGVQRNVTADGNFTAGVRKHCYIIESRLQRMRR